MKLRDLLVQISYLNVNPDHPALDQEITGIKTNSHNCNPGDLFIGMPGTRVDGGEFWHSAQTNGAIAAIITPNAAIVQPPTPDFCVIVCEDMVQVCADIAAIFYNHPTDQLLMVGVTGTNGKTTTTHIIEYCLQQTGKNTALLGTLYTRWPGYQKTATHTTPFTVELQEQLAKALTADCRYGVMEVSSHALHQGRVKGCKFSVAVFTNLTQDHLDYHQTMEDYFQAKALLFNDDYLVGRGIVNLNDPYGKRLVESLPKEKVWSYSVNNSAADLWTSDLVYQSTGISGLLHTPMGSMAFSSSLVGNYNLENILAAIGTLLHLGVDLEQAVRSIASFTGVPGRMEQVKVSEKQDISVIVDYAHTPDSLENLLKAARPFIPGKMICVFGCGGDRDRTKRPIMGKIAATLADVAIVTSDNPRTENPEQILADVVGGIPDHITTYHVEGDRQKAIALAISQAVTGDGVLIAGKGHEDYQILGTEKVHFDDREQARLNLSNRYSVN
jgi:UDP-N-acetylmuramoyl-L-alanyl-D-glutamate--2,6-diaminopimelate ligase